MRTQPLCRVPLLLMRGTQSTMATVIVFGNEKGGTGKSTLAIHVAVALASQGMTVTTVDGDPNQGSLTRYLENRARFIDSQDASSTAASLPVPELVPTQDWQDWDAAAVEAQLRGLQSQVIIVDTPGAHSPLSEILHGFADLLITPLNDSLVDLSVLAEVDQDTGQVQRPSHYAERVWQARQARARRDGGSFAWVVLRNRLSALDAHNKRLMADILDKLEDRIGCRVGPGFGERVIFRELFLQGLTLSDFEDRDAGLAWTVSHVAARQELRGLLDLITEVLNSGEDASHLGQR